MKPEDLYWCIGFLESQASFAICIGLPKSKNKRYVVLKPYIVIANTDDFQVNYIKRLIGIEAQARIKKTPPGHRKVYSLNIQNEHDIDRLLDVFTREKFKSKVRQERLDRFRDCYESIKEVGFIHTTWKKEFTGIIKKKLAINDIRAGINKNRFTQSVWEEKIKKHLEE